MGLFITQSCMQTRLGEAPTTALSLSCPFPALATPSKASGMHSVVKHVREPEKQGASSAQMAAALSDPYGGHYWPWETGLGAPMSKVTA